LYKDGAVATGKPRCNCSICTFMLCTNGKINNQGLCALKGQAQPA
jgi:hypothetical protein